jgi:hypothetical protein
MFALRIPAAVRPRLLPSFELQGSITSRGRAPRFATRFSFIVSALLLMSGVPVVAGTATQGHLSGNWAKSAALVQPAAAPPYSVRTFDLRPIPWSWLSFTGGRIRSVPPPGPRDANDIPLFRWSDGRLYYRPGSLAMSGMRQLDAFVRKGDPKQLDQALAQAAKLRELADHLRSAWWLPFEFDYRAQGLHGPWYNAMTQGLVLSFFVRLYRVTGDVVHLDAADRVFESFRQLGAARHPWVARVAGGDLWLEHYPGGHTYKILNAHLHATLGLFEYWQATQTPIARQVLEGALTTMRDNAGRFRRPGELSRYCLLCSYGMRKYHAIHIWQLHLLARISGAYYFARVANQMAHDSAPQGWAPGQPRQP